MKNYEEFIRRLENYEKSIDELNSASFIDEEKLTNQMNMHKARLVYFVKTRINEDN